MTCEPALLTSKLSVPAGASVADRSQAESVELTVTVRGGAGVVTAARGAFSVQAARAGRRQQQREEQGWAQVHRGSHPSGTRECGGGVGASRAGVGTRGGAPDAVWRRRTLRKKSTIVGTR